MTGTLTPAMHLALTELDKAECEERFDDAEIVCDGIECWLGYRRVSYRTVKALLKLMALSFDESGGAQHYTLNDTGRAIQGRPALAKEIYAAVLKGRPFTLANGKIKHL